MRAFAQPTTLKRQISQDSIFPRHGVPELCIHDAKKSEGAGNTGCFGRTHSLGTLAKQGRAQCGPDS
jgi:hypothetical protein